MRAWTTGVVLGLALAAAPALAMSKAEGEALLRQRGIDPLPENLVQNIVTGDADVVEALIAAGVDVNAKTGLPQAPLTLAAMSCAGGRTAPAVTARMMDALIKAGADPNAPGMAGLGPLMTASQQCGALPVQTLLAAGAKADVRTPQGFTPLTMALITRHFDAARALIDAGSRLTAGEASKLVTGSDDDELKALVAKATP